jgi:hypothetical protein
MVKQLAYQHLVFKSHTAALQFFEDPEGKQSAGYYQFVSSRVKKISGPCHQALEDSLYASWEDRSVLLEKLESGKYLP